MSAGPFAQASEYAQSVDRLFLALGIFGGLCAAAVLGLVIAFCLRYRRGSHAERRPRIVSRPWLEYSWTAAALAVFLALFVRATDLYLELFQMPSDALEINVTAARWSWRFEHPDGQTETGELHVPAGRPIRTVMRSEDVIHSFFVPALRMKKDVVPGYYTSTWFEVSEPGEYRIFCAEYCGTQHSAMRASLIVTSQAAYQDWLEQSAAPASKAEQGARLFAELGCVACHAEDSATPAPELAGIVGKQVRLSSGRSVRVDENYLRESIMQPKKHVVEGYQPIMPSFAGQLGQGDVTALIAYIKSLSTTAGE